MECGGIEVQGEESGNGGDNEMPVSSLELKNPSKGVLNVTVKLKNDRSFDAEIHYKITLEGPGQVDHVTEGDTIAIVGETVTEVHEYEVQGGNYDVCAEITSVQDAGFGF